MVCACCRCRCRALQQQQWQTARLLCLLRTAPPQDVTTGVRQLQADLDVLAADESAERAERALAAKRLASLRAALGRMVRLAPAAWTNTCILLSGGFCWHVDTLSAPTNLPALVLCVTPTGPCRRSACRFASPNPWEGCPAAAAGGAPGTAVPCAAGSQNHCRTRGGQPAPH